MSEVPDIENHIRISMRNDAELKRLQEEFDAQARRYPDLTFSVKYVGDGFPVDPIPFRRPNHLVMLWQYVGATSDIDNETLVSGLQGDLRFGFVGAKFSAFGVIEGAETDLFRRMASRAGSLVPLLARSMIDVKARKWFNAPDRNNKSIFISNDDSVAVWLNLILLTIERFQPERIASQKLAVDPFTASLAVFDHVFFPDKISADPPHEGRPARDQVFFSYSHMDRKWLEKFRIMLKPALHDDMLWDDTKIVPGAKWKDAIRKSLASAKVAVLLVSKHFLASDFIGRNELPPLLAAAEQAGITILWVPVGFSMYKATEIAKYQPTQDPSRPLDSLKGAARDKAIVSICEKIKEAAERT